MSELKSRLYFPFLSILRAIAVLQVLIFHFYKSILPFGYYGVDIFFTLSAFVITLSLNSSITSDVKLVPFLTLFYRKRVRRILPALLVCGTLSYFLALYLVPTPWTSQITILSSLFGLSNLYLIKQQADYFAASADLNIFLHSWSLSVEEQFYLIFPVSFFLSKRLFPRLRFGANLSILLLVVTFFCFISYSLFTSFLIPLTSTLSLMLIVLINVFL